MLLKFELRQSGDYGDMFYFEKEEVNHYFIPVSEFISTIKKIIASID